MTRATSEPVISSIAGLQLSQNTFSASPPGSLSKAINGVISQKGVFQPRNGQERNSTLPAAADLPFALAEFQGHILVNYGLSKTDTSMGLGIAPSVSGGPSTPSWVAVASGTTQNLAAIWGASANDIWAVGAAGTILHWDGSAWSAVASGTANDLTGVHGFASNDIWAVGLAGTILHWNGSAWSIVASPTANALDAVFGVATSDVWASGPFGDAIHWNGATWSSVPTGTGNSLYSIWGAATNDIWFGSFNGTFFHWDGANITSVTPGTTDYFIALFGFGAGNVWAAGGGNDGGTGATIWHYNGATWTLNTAWPAALSPNELDSVWGSGASDIWVGDFDGTIWHYNGSAWAAVTSPTTESLVGAWGFSFADAWMVGTNGAIIHYSSSALTVLGGGPFNPVGDDGVATDYGRMKFALASMFLHFCCASSPKVLETYNGTPRASGLPRMPDLTRGVLSLATLSPGVIPYNSSVAYASLARRPTSTGSLLLGPPSNHYVVTNRIFMPVGSMVRTGGNLVTVTLLQGVNLAVELLVGDTFTLTPGEANFVAGTYAVVSVAGNVFTYTSVGANVANTTAEDANTGARGAGLSVKLATHLVAGDKVRLYKSVATSSSNIEPSEDLYLCNEVTLSSTNISAGTVLMNDTTPESVLQDPLYTNPTDGDGFGLVGANFQVPIYADLTAWDSHVFYLNTKGQQYLDLQMLGVGATNGIQDGDTFIVIANANTYTFTFKNVPVGTNDVQIISGGTPSYNIALTTKNLITLLARPVYGVIVEGVLATGSTSPNGFPGAFRLERVDFGTAFTVRASRPASWTPALDPTTATSSFPDNRPNGLVWGKLGEPEAVPVINATTVGAANFYGRRCFGLRNSLIILKEGDGIWSLTGSNGAYSLRQISTANIIAPDAAAVFFDSVWAYTDQGILKISDTGGVEVVSRPIETELNALATLLPAETYAWSFAVAYETERRIMFFIPFEAATAATGGAPLLEAWAYSAATNAWTGPLAFNGTAISGLVSTAHKLWVGLYDDTFAAGRLTSERKTDSHLDIADDAWANALTTTADPLVVALATAGDIQQGIGISQVIGGVTYRTKIEAVLGGGLYQLAETVPWTTGACVMYDAFEVEPQFLPEGHPGSRKVLTRLLTVYKPGSFASYYGVTTLETDQIQAELEIPTPAVGFGLSPFGQGGFGNPSPMVVDTNPIDPKWVSAGQFFPGLKFNEVWIQLKLQGLGMQVDGASAPAGRGR